jgi:hypothetical protein
MYCTITWRRHCNITVSTSAYLGSRVNAKYIINSDGSYEENVLIWSTVALSLYLPSGMMEYGHKFCVTVPLPAE